MITGEADACFYTRLNKDEFEITIMIYVDDIILISREEGNPSNEKATMSKKLKVKDTGTIKWFLEIDISERPEGIFLTQTTYV